VRRLPLHWADCRAVPLVMDTLVLLQPAVHPDDDACGGQSHGRGRCWRVRASPGRR